MGCGFNFTDIIAFAKRVWLRGVIGCTVSDSAVSVTPQMLYVISEGFLKLSKLVLVLSDSSSWRTSTWWACTVGHFHLANFYCLTLPTWRTCTVWLFNMAMANLYCFTLPPGELVLYDSCTWWPCTVWLLYLVTLLGWLRVPPWHGVGSGGQTEGVLPRPRPIHQRVPPSQNV